MAAPSSGILLHPTSLPGPYGCGDLGPESRRFLKQLAQSEQSVWQTLPLGPTGPHHSPYDCQSVFAGNELLISPQDLVDDGLLARSTLDDLPQLCASRIDPAARTLERQLLRTAWSIFRDRSSHRLRQRYDEFVQAPQQHVWLEDWVLFAGLRERYQGRSWLEWPAKLRDRAPDALAEARRELGDEPGDTSGGPGEGPLGFHRFVQFLFFRQWQSLRSRASDLGIRLCGDLPIYVALDSADVWSHRELFDLDAMGRPQSVAGVPPDAFTADGQLWGNPTYRWPAHRKQGYLWWRQRLEADLARFDLLRIDHFRGFVAYWKVPHGSPTARDGHWARGPGQALFKALFSADGGVRPKEGPLPLIAEDLGQITEPVRSLRKELGLPGIRVLQFGFDDPDSEHRPDRVPSDAVVYTGTHDNDTSLSWFERHDPRSRHQVTRALGLEASAPPRAVVRRLIEAAFESAAELAMVPLQDLLELGGEARMNLPGTVEGNWLWRAPEGLLDKPTRAWLRALTERTGRARKDHGDHREYREHRNLRDHGDP